MRKIITLGVMLLFLGMTISSSTGLYLEKQSTIATLDGNTLYVGGSGPNNYTKIQNAIDDANDGDTVYVYDDSSPYYENVVINKSINLVGEDKDTTIIDGEEIDDVINVTADRVNISGFTIQNCGNRTLYIYSDAGTDVRADYCTISGNIFISNYANGIALLWANNNVISDNILVDNEHTGIHLSHYCNNNTIRNNTVEQSHNAIELIIKCENNTIINNTASYCELAGVNFYWDCNNNIVSENTIINNYHGIWHYDSHNNKFHNNTISNGEVGIQLINSNNNSICYNAIFGHRYQFYPYGKGIIIEESNFTNVAHNIFYDNDICIFCDDSDENNIVQNIFSNNNLAIFLEDSDRNNILQNIFLNNNQGIYLGVSDNNNISQNIFSNDSSINLDSSYSNVINYNNLDSDTYVSFIYRRLRTVLNNPQTSTSAPKIIFPNNNWNYNYWGESRILPKLIWGSIGIFGLIPWINFDWHPAQEPYDIGV